MFGMKWFLTTFAKNEEHEEQFEGLGENFHKKMHQGRGLLHNQRIITPLFFRSSEEGDGQPTYLRLVSVSGKIHCCILIGKSRVTPKKYVTIPRMELVATVLSLNKAALIRK